MNLNFSVRFAEWSINLHGVKYIIAQNAVMICVAPAIVKKQSFAFMPQKRTSYVMTDDITFYKYVKNCKVECYMISILATNNVTL